MGTDPAAAPVQPTGATSRRRVLAFLGAGGVAAFASLFSRGAAQAGHDGTNALHLGEGNSTPPGRKTGVASDVPSFAFDVDNFNTSGTGGGLHGRSLGGLPALQGVGHEPSFAGVFGVSSPASGELGKGSRTGVAGLSGSGTGVDGRSESGIGVSGHSAGEGVQGSSGTGTGVVGFATGPGIGVEARAGVDGERLDAIALNVRGKARFSTAGAAVIPGGEEALFVPNPAVTGESHISLTLAGDPGQSHVSWVEQDAGTGFTVHLSRSLRRGADVPLTYLITEPA